MNMIAIRNLIVKLYPVQLNDKHNMIILLELLYHYRVRTLQLVF